MPDRKPAQHPLNSINALNRAALRVLMEAKAEAPAHHLHLLNLAAWGLENKATGEWPDQDRTALQEQVSLLFGWKPLVVMNWLLSNPNGPDKVEQTVSLLNEMNLASTPKAAAAAVLNAIYSRQQSQNPALQPSASASD